MGDDFFLGLEAPTGLGGLARDLGLRFVSGSLDRQYQADLPEGLPDLPLLTNGGRDRVSDMCYGAFGGLPLQLFTYEAVGYVDDPSNVRRTCVLFTLPSHFPMLTVGPHTRLSRVQERSNDPFAARFRVLGRDPEVAELVLDEPMQRWLMTVDESLRIELSGRALLGHTPAKDPDDIPGLLQQLYGVYLRIPDQAWARFGTDITL